MTDWEIFDNYQCSPTGPHPVSPHRSFHGGRGITYWNMSSTIVQAKTGTIPGAATLTFTPTHPDCFIGKNDCNVLFRASVNNNSGSDYVRLGFKLNDFAWSGCCLPGTTGYDNWQAFDLAFVNDDGNYKLNADQTNTLVFTNDGDVSVTISDLKMYNAYQMCNLFDCEDEKEGCTSFSFRGTVSAFDATRVGADYPCSYETGGSRSISYAQGGPYDGHTLNSGETFTWTFDWSLYSQDNYSQGDVCLTNFNQVYVTSEDSSHNYTTLDAYINDYKYATYYLVSRDPEVDGQGNTFYFPLFPSYNLMSGSAALYYNDNGANTLKLVNNGPVPVLMCDGAGINLYRIYRTYQATPVEQAPNTPSLSGPTTAGVNVPSRNFSIQATDPQGDSIAYAIDWGNGLEPIDGSFPSGYRYYVQHTWTSQGTKTVTAKAYDATPEHSFRGSSLSACHTIQVNATPPIPDTPTSLSGPNAGTVGINTGPYNATSNLGYDLRRFEFNWNGTTEEFAGPNTITVNHAWGTPGTKTVQVRVRDVSDQWSNPATFSPVTIQAESPAQYYLTTIIAQGVEPNGGTFETLSNATGSLNDANYAHLWGDIPTHGAWMIGVLNEQATGKIEICGSGEISTGPFQGAASICVSDDTINFGNCALPYIPTDPAWIDCGTVDTPFRYIKIGISDPDNTTHLQIDSIRVTPTQYCTSAVSSSSGGGTATPSGSSQHPINVYVQFQATPDEGYVFSHWIKDGTTTVYDNPYTLQMATNHTLDAVFDPICGACNTTCQDCQTGCEVSCQTCYTSCQDACELSCQDCQTGCQVSCQTGCEVSCQSTCELACQVGCEVSCQTGCEVSCQSCNTCQTTCELACQATCEVSCQDQCQVCEVCNTACYAECQTQCQLSCQTGCEVACQTTCELACQTGCETSCQTGCEVACQSCQTCEGCEWCELFCEDMCMYCETQ
jgi:hypothetical protein